MKANMIGLKGDAAFRAGQCEEAATHYRKAVMKMNPDNAVCWSNLAAALLKVER